jgi:uncharacterized RDD family membrane protein YckC
MKLEKPIVILLLIQGLAGVYYQVGNFYVPHWIQYGSFPDFFDIAETMRTLCKYVSIIFTLVGGVQVLQRQELKLFKAFKFPMYYGVVSAAIWLFTSLLSTKYSYINFSSEMPIHTMALIILNQILVLLVIIHFSSKTDETEFVTTVPVNKSSRFLNLVIDRLIVFAFTFSFINILGSGSVVAEIPLLNDNPYWFFAINIFIYYFVQEALFKQTIGKLHNGAIVIGERSRVKMALIRTICRFIPLEAFSFFGQKGWHDSISGTNVVKTTEQSLENEEL